MEQVELVQSAHPCIEMYDSPLVGLRKIFITPDNDIGLTAQIAAPRIKPSFYHTHDTLCQYRAWISIDGVSRHIKMTPTNYLMVNTLLNDLPALKEYLLSIPDAPSQANIDYENRNYQRSSESTAFAVMRGETVDSKPKVKRAAKKKVIAEQPDLFETA